MATHIFYTVESSLLPYAAYLELLAKLPQNMQSRIIAYKQPMDRQLRMAGKLLLKFALAKLNFEPLLFEALSYTESNKPVLTDFSINFSISHSGTIALCAINTTGNIGADIEEIMPREIELLADNFNEDSWKSIINSPDKLISFYKAWTQREAVIKNIGYGFPVTDMARITISGDTLNVYNQAFYHYTTTIENTYILSLASSNKISAPVFHKVTLGGL